MATDKTGCPVSLDLVHPHLGDLRRNTSARTPLPAPRQETSNSFADRWIQAKIGSQFGWRLIYDLTPPLPPFPPFRFALMVRCRIDSVMTPWRS
jgi:hypothetical protein